jgi:hypothetical protein
MRDRAKTRFGTKGLVRTLQRHPQTIVFRLVADLSGETDQPLFTQVTVIVVI